jgi:hypothetical protein
MDSKAINKLIRSEIWPILRQQGFTRFDSRTAHAYHGSFINVVNFQSFNSYLAEGVGCTTYSFALNLGVYVIGSPWESNRERDQDGRLHPSELECSFREQVRKRAPVDGFNREDIFYIHPDGRTTAQCFREVKYLLTEVAPSWFEARNNLDALLSRMQHLVSTGDPGIFARPNSYSWDQLRSLLLLLKHQQSPTQQSANSALASINSTIGNILDFSTIQTERPRQERYAFEIRELWDKLGDYRPQPACTGKSDNPGGHLDSPSFVYARSSGQALATSANPLTLFSPRKQLWPILKRVGFVEFTDRLAHRITKDAVEVVEYLPMDRMERKAWNLPTGFFRVGVGISWPLLNYGGIFRKNRKDEPRPTVNECDISNWLVPETTFHKEARTAFHSIEDAACVLAQPALGWLEILRNHGSALSFLQRPDWELFWCYPMMRGYGASPSSRRLIYLAFLNRMLGENAESEVLIRRAEEVVDPWYPEHFRSRYQAWTAEAKSRLREHGRRTAPPEQA